MEIKGLFSKSALALAPYSPIEPPDQIAKRLQIPEEKLIKLDANENPYGTAPQVLQALGQAKYYSIYPDPAQVQLRQAIASYAGGEPEGIVVGTGADELLDLLCRLVLEPGEKVITFVPTFSYYGHVVGLNRGQLVELPREKDWSIDPAKLAGLDLTGVKMVFLCSPNNPTGNLLERPVLDFFLAQDLLVVVDEAYFEFSGQSYLELLPLYPNLVILRTFSKCFALAGLRVGYGVMHPQVAKVLMSIKPPFSVNVAAEVALKCALENLEHFQNQLGLIRKARDWFYQAMLQQKQVEIYPSQSNFLLLKINQGSAAEVKHKLEQQGILIRYFNTPLLANYIRVSVGTQAQMERLAQALESLLAK